MEQLTETQMRSIRFSSFMASQVAHGRARLVTTNDVGERCMVAALAEESVASLFQRVERVGGYATVFVRMEDGSVYMVPFVREDGALPAPDASDLDVPRDADSSVGMFVDYLLAHPEGVRLNVSGPHRLPSTARAVREPVAV